MKLLLHADDFGISENITDMILECVNGGCLNSTSIVANGVAFEYAAARFKETKGVSLAVHLNLVEGIPVLPPDRVPMLVDSAGILRNTFGSLWRRYVFSGTDARRRLRTQVKDELVAQIDKVRHILAPDAPLRFDSHMHTHMVPFIFDCIMEIASEYPVTYIRIPREPFFMYRLGAPSLPYVRPVNIVKHLLLRFLSRSAEKRLNSHAADSADHFLGVLFTGRMVTPVVVSALRMVGRRVPKNGSVEILLHPGGMHERERDADRIQYEESYLSPYRRMEQEALQNDVIKAMVSDLQDDS